MGETVTIENDGEQGGFKQTDGGVAVHRLNIKKLGPIEHCEFVIENFCILTGEQASGKSTIAKAVFFFRTIKEDIVSLFLKRNIAGDTNRQLRSILEKTLRSKFLQIFGSSWSMDMDMSLIYHYSENTWAKISLKENTFPGEPNYIYSEFSRDIYEYLNEAGRDEDKKELDIRLMRDQVNELFHDKYEIVFIPAGREMITLLTNQLNYIFTIMDDSQKRSIDYCTQSYIEQILKIKPMFENGMRGMYQNKLLMTEDTVSKKILKQIMGLIDTVLKGRYVYVSGEERLVLDNSKYVKMNYTSSGQQESIWIFNLIFYFVLENRMTYLILEEPESHLYPESQKQMAELISLFLHAGNGGIVTTHSPYLLGAFNNLLYASFLGRKNPKEVEAVISRDKWIDADGMNALFVEKGGVTDILDEELLMIKNETIDEISTVINSDNEKLMQIHLSQEN